MCLRPVEACCQNLTGCVHVIVDGLLAHDDQTGVFTINDHLEQLGDGQRFEIGIGLHQNAAIGAHGHGRAQYRLGFCHADGHDHDFGGGAFFAKAHGLFDSNFIEGIHRHLHALRVDAAVIGLHAGLDVVINHPLDRDHYLHLFLADPGNLDWVHTLLRLKITYRPDNSGRPPLRARTSRYSVSGP